jgi:predicted nucleotidyltransferase
LEQPPTLQTILRPFDRRIACVFVYGSVARREEHAASEIDLLVVGGLADLTPGLRKAEARSVARSTSPAIRPRNFGRRRGRRITCCRKSRGTKSYSGRATSVTWTTLLASQDVQRHRTSRRELDDSMTCVRWSLAPGPTRKCTASQRIGGSPRRTTPRSKPRTSLARAPGSESTRFSHRIPD